MEQCIFETRTVTGKTLRLFKDKCGTEKCLLFDVLVPGVVKVGGVISEAEAQRMWVVLGREFPSKKGNDNGF
jgi:hypothetical protein